MTKSVQVFICLLILMSFLLPTKAGIFHKKNVGKENGITESKSSKKDDGKILLVEIYASWCPGCKNIQPALDEVVKEITGVELVQLDVSTPSKAKLAEKKAAELNVINFYKSNKSKTATVGVVIPFKSEVVTIFHNNNNVDDYKIAIQEAKTKEKTLEP